MSIELDSLILRGNELNTVGPATENDRRANLVRTRCTSSIGVPAERIGLASTATVNMSWRYGGVNVVSTLGVSTRCVYTSLMPPQQHLLFAAQHFSESVIVSVKHDVFLKQYI